LDVAEADLTDWAATEKALAGVEGVFHIAAAFDVTQLSAAELCRINVGSTENVLRACAKHGVRRIVTTSSAAAVGTSGPHREVRDENVWNDHTREPYAQSKVKAERRAWELAGELRLSLVSALPGAMLGPGFHRLTPTLKMIHGAIDNAFPMLPPIDFAFTDVRDVANAHIRLYECGSSGRYLLAGPTVSFRALLEEVHQLRPDVRVPKEMAAWFARVLPALDAASHVLTRAPRTIRSGFVGEYVGRSHVLSMDKASREIQWSPRPLATTLADTLTWMEAQRNYAILDA
jgi:dihydroflavonol-4-reductase